MQIEAEYTIKLSAYEVIALTKTLGELSQIQQIENGLTLGQAAAASDVRAALKLFQECGVSILPDEGENDEEEA